MDGGWPAAVAHKLHQSHPIKYKDRPGGGVIVFAECSTCSKEEEFYFAKKMPPEAIAKKLQRKGWDTKKRRCPACRTAGRRTRRHEPEPLPIKSALHTEIERVFGQTVEREPLPVIELGRHMDAKISINNKNIKLNIPRDSQFIQAFMTESFKPKAHWEIDLIQDSPQEEPVIRVRRAHLPPGKERAYGMVQGNYISQKEAFQVSMAKSGIKGIDMFGEFGTVEARLIRQDEDSFFFKLPKRRPPILNRTHKKSVEKPTTVEAMREVVAPPPPAQIESSAPVAPNGTKKVSLKEAVTAINKYVDQYGTDLILAITSNGKLRASLEYGDHDD